MVSKNIEITTVESQQQGISSSNDLRFPSKRKNSVTGIEIEIFYHRATNPMEMSSDFGHRPKEDLYSIIHDVFGQNVSGINYR